MFKCLNVRMSAPEEDTSSKAIGQYFLTMYDYFLSQICFKDDMHVSSGRNCLQFTF